MSTEDLQQFKQEFIQKLEETLSDMSEVFQKYGLSPECFQLEVNLTQIQADGEDINKGTAVTFATSSPILRIICPIIDKTGGTRCLEVPQPEI